MRVILNGKDTTIILTADQLGTLRYALHIAEDKLASDARYHASMKSVCAHSSKQTARAVTALDNALEKATQKACRVKTPPI